MTSSVQWIVSEDDVTSGPKHLKDNITHACNHSHLGVFQFKASLGKNVSKTPISTSKPDMVASISVSVIPAAGKHIQEDYGLKMATGKNTRPCLKNN
jgi:hypothetical protein